MPTRGSTAPVLSRIKTTMCPLAVSGHTVRVALTRRLREASHRTLLRSRTTNDWVGNWLCAYPIWSDLGPYRRFEEDHPAHPQRGTRRSANTGSLAWREQGSGRQLGRWIQKWSLGRRMRWVISGMRSCPAFRITFSILPTSILRT